MKCPKCGSNKTKPLDSGDLARKVYGSGSLRCKKCDYLVCKSDINLNELMSGQELKEIKEKGERFSQAWYTDQLITKIKRGW